MKKDVVVQRLKNLEAVLKNKFVNNWVSVRKAFLDLDFDYDGYITVEDMIRFFGSQELDYEDLKKLIKEKDS